MNLGKKVTFEAAGKTWTVQPFSLSIWFQFCEWLKQRPRTSDPLERVARLPLDKMPPEMAERLVREAIDEDKKLHDFRPESEATKNALSSIEGIIKVISLLSGEGEDVCRDMVLSLAQENKLDVLTKAISDTIGHVEKKVTA